MEEATIIIGEKPTGRHCLGEGCEICRCMGIAEEAVLNWILGVAKGLERERPKHYPDDHYAHGAFPMVDDLEIKGWNAALSKLREEITKQENGRLRAGEPHPRWVLSSAPAPSLTT